MSSDEDDVSEEESDSKSESESGSSDAESSSNSGSESENERESDEDEGDTDDNEQQLADAKRERVHADIAELRRMTDEMEKVKVRLQFRLEREKQSRAEEAQWLRQQQLKAAEEEEARQHGQPAVTELIREELAAQGDTQANEGNQTPQRPLRPDPTRHSLVEVAVQTEDPRVDVPNEVERHADSGQSAQAQDMKVQDASTNKTVPLTAPASEHPSARLSLFDLGRSYGMDERSDTRQKYRGSTASSTAPAGGGGEGERAHAAPASDVSESETFFIRRDSARTSWQPDQAPLASRLHRLGATESLLHSQGSVSEFGVDEQAPESPLPPAERSARTTKSSFHALRNSILSSIHEVPSNAASGVSSPRLASSRSGEWKSEEQREQEAIRTLLFGR